MCKSEATESSSGPVSHLQSASLEPRLVASPSCKVEDGKTCQMAAGLAGEVPWAALAAREEGEEPSLTAAAVLYCGWEGTEPGSSLKGNLCWCSWEKWQ